MLEAGARVRKIISEETMLSRLAQSEQMREFFIQMWMQNPGLAKQGGIKVQDLMTRLGGDAPHVFSQQPSIVATAKQRGISLIELIMFIMIVSVALAGILLVMNVTTRNSADPLIHKQALAIAEALLEEVELMPFTYCDPNDPAAATANSTADCTAPAGGEAMGPEAVETRYSTATPFDNVNDYDGCQMNTGVANAGCDSTGTVGVRDITGAAVGPAGYRVAIAVTNNGMPAAGAAPVIPNNVALLITVTVTGPDNLPVVLEGIRTRYSPKI